ncbi:Pectic acid lyase [Aquisphaera giovannonii]|uniref:Pectic acid lyase n=1 Tax=Aquisphaera giovannonii TaxID=406548 RepID=A0A5B9W8N0_9BACT|nr:prenyltransferase/squalene oxidase repeat-containing protein [Aquisphaera giovannonii]QEH36992.1 Pectic acid lyase [Aquisphaera giovannonii]
MDAGPPAPERPQKFRRWLDDLARRYDDTETVYSVPSWGLSLMLHALLLLILALLIRAGNGTSEKKEIKGAIAIPAIGDLSSLVEADRAGDPFTKEQTDDQPSIGLETIEPIARFAQPEIPNLERFAPDLSGPNGDPKGGVKILNEASGAGTLRGGAQFPSLSADISAPFSGRQGLDRAQLVRREGGTVHSEKAVEEGLEWLVRHQAADGSWSLNFQDHCGADPCPAERTMESQTAATGLALLPLLGAGYIHNVKCRHQDSVRRGIEWLIHNQQPNGDLFTGPPGIAYMYSHAIGAMALCEAYGLSRDSNLKEPARHALEFIIESQNSQTGGWRYAPGQAGDTSVFGWQIFALRSGHLAGLTVPKSTLKGCSDWLNAAATDSKKVLYAYQPGHEVSPIMTAEALVARQLLGWPRNHPSLVKGAGRIAAHLESNKDRNIYYWYYATQLLHNMKNKDWEKWNPEVREGLIGAQVKDDSCANGSWDPFQPNQDRWGVVAGRLFQTSLSILTLEVYYRYLPLYRTSDTDGLEANAAPPEARKKPQAGRQP